MLSKRNKRYLRNSIIIISLLSLLLIATVVVSTIINQGREIQAYKEGMDDLLKRNQELHHTVIELSEQVTELQEKYDSIKAENDAMKAEVSFNPNNVSEPSNATVYHMKKMLKGTSMYQYAENFVKAEKAYGVNALFLAGIVANESSWGTSSRAKNQNNLTGYAVYSNISRGATFDSGAQSIYKTARLLQKEYLTPSGLYYNGLSIWDVNQRYCMIDGQANPIWSSEILDIINHNLKPILK